MRKAKILLVDDEPGIISVLEILFIESGYQIKSASNGLGALKEVQEYKPDLIILDVELPDFDGFEVCRRLKKDPETENIPILMLTVREKQEDKQRGFDIEIDDYLTKPFNNEELIARVNAVLKRFFLSSPPFSDSDKNIILSIVCIPHQKLHILLEGEMDTTIITKQDLEIDVNEFDRKVQKIPQKNWRFDAKDVGKLLFEIIFEKHKELYEYYNKTFGRRPLIQFKSERDFLRVPIETLFGTSDYLSLEFPVTRYINNIPNTKRPLSPIFFNEIWRAKQEFRALLIASDSGGIPLVDQEIQIISSTIKESLEEKEIRVSVKTILTEEATYKVIEDELKRNKNYHLIHFAGHGKFDKKKPEKSSIFFWEDRNRSGEFLPLYASQLQIYLRDSETRFVYLSICEGGKTTDKSKLLDYDSLGIADSLVTQATVPAVLGFRWALSDKGAEAFSREFYSSLFKHGKLEVALLDARQAIAAKDKDDITWISPILIMQD